MARKHYQEQIDYANDYLIPNLEKRIPDFDKKSVVEVGCGEGGLVEILHRRGMEAMGIEISPSRVAVANEKSPDIDVIQGDITDDAFIEKMGRKFDIIILKEVIEHIPDRESTFRNLDKMLNEGGVIYMSFPPYFSAYAGHQQTCKRFKFFPWIHFWPDFLIRGVGKLLKEDQKGIDLVVENGHIGISISRVVKFYKAAGFKTKLMELFLSRPSFKIRYGLPIIRFPNIPLIREVWAMGCEVFIIRDK